MEHKAFALVLPASIVSPSDVGRLLREVQELDDYLHQMTIRTPGTPMHLPRLSRLMDEIIAANKLNALQPVDRQHLTDFLSALKKQAPVLQMSFSADPSPLFTQRLITWLRANIHPAVLLRVGLQPSIGAGSIVRTNNHSFDFSLRSQFRDRRQLLIEKLRGSVT